jgi:hypothetical protein
MSGTTASFNQSGPWTMSWTYDCSSALAGIGNFIVQVNGSIVDQGTNEVGAGGSGTDYYYDTGTFSLVVTSECNWAITVIPGSGAATGTPVTITSAEIGVDGNSQAISIGGAWTMAWSYDCTGTLGGTGTFSVNINEPPGDLNFDLGPNESGVGGSGVDSYSNTGTLTLSSISECPWSITINSSGSSQAATTPTGFPTPVTGMASTPDGRGYWITNAYGDISQHGDAWDFGSLAGHTLNAPITHIVPTPDGKGYWLV